MKPFYQDPELTIYAGDWVENLRLIPENSIHCVITSPPYWGLRNYGIDRQLGLEKTPDEYIAKMVAGFEEVRRVLRKDGTLWLNIGDSYARSAGDDSKKSPDSSLKTGRNGKGKELFKTGNNRPPMGLKPKDLVGIPWMLAFALRAAGWYLRCDVIWFKPNPMPESVKDRPTKSHEYFFLLTKSANYYYDQEAILEECSESTHMRVSQDVASQIGSERANGGAKTNGNMKAVVRRGGLKLQADGSDGIKYNESFAQGTCLPVTKRNKRSVWEVTTKGYKNAHFATFPPELIQPCVLAGTSEHGCCANCGAPYKRLVKRGNPDLVHQKMCGGDRNGQYHGKATKDFALNNAQDASATKARILEGMTEKITYGWRKTCKCENAGVVPCSVLDPFAGSGTTAQVSLELRRKAVAIELNPKYIDFVKERAFAIPFSLL